MAKLRAAIYARHSTGRYDLTSNDPQIVICRALAAQIGAEVVKIYTDSEISVYCRDRPGLKQMLSEIEQESIDIVLCEELHRIARDGEDINWLGKKLSYHRVRLFTQTNQEINGVTLAVAGLLSAMFLTDLRTKIFRDIKAAVLAGRLVGGSAYACRKVAREDANGRLLGDGVEIDSAKAVIVDRICREFADGRSSISIATGLNRDGIPAPRGGEWNVSTIRGDSKRLVGILNNPLYRGTLIWARGEWCKNPDSDRRERRYRFRNQSEWIEVDMPDLRIIDEDVAQRVDAELKRRSTLRAR